MKKILFFLLILLFTGNSVNAENMVQKINYLQFPLHYVGLPDFPPFSYYDTQTKKWKGAFLKPTAEALERHGVTFIPGEPSAHNFTDIKLTLIDVRSGTYELFIGANSDTRLYKGLELIHPAVISNPIHVITLPETQQTIKSYSDLRRLRGCISKAEYFSDFVLRKTKELNVEFVDTPFDAYKKLFTGDVDYILGSLYFNKIEASKHGIERYLSFSKNPLYKIPVFIAMSKVTPMMSEYLRTLSEEFKKPEYGTAVKQEVIRIIDEEIQRNEGIVPPSFTKEEAVIDEEKVDENENIVENINNSGHIIKKEVETVTFDEVLDGI